MSEQESLNFEEAEALCRPHLEPGQYVRMISPNDRNTSSYLYGFNPEEYFYFLVHGPEAHIGGSPCLVVDRKTGTVSRIRNVGE